MVVMAPSSTSTSDDLTVDLVALRRDLHRHPELGLELPRTQKRILDVLRPFDLDITLGHSCSSITAVLRGTKAAQQPAEPRPAVLLRGDMDALPVEEETGLDFASTVPGKMHACGHDLHMSILVGAVERLVALRDQLAGDVVFMFQPGEEGYDGASVMIDEGVLTASGHKVDAAYSLHVFSAGPPPGQVGVRRGAMMSAADAFRVTVTGQGGHGSAPHLAQDPVPAMAEMITAIQTLITRRLDVFEPVVISVGTVQAGTQRNIIPETASFEATVRTYSHAVQQQVEAELQRLVTGIADAHGVSVQADYQHEYPPTVNDPQEADFALEVARRLLGEDRCVELERPYTASEDFSRVLDQVPGAFLSLGAEVPAEEGGHGAFNHSAKAMYDESVLADGADLLAELALRRLATGSPRN